MKKLMLLSIFNLVLFIGLHAQQVSPPLDDDYPLNECHCCIDNNYYCEHHCHPIWDIPHVEDETHREAILNLSSHYYCECQCCGREVWCDPWRFN